MAGKVEIKTSFFLTRWMRGLYQWVMRWADSPHAEKMLGILSFAESSFFPIPPDVLLIPMGVSRPDRAIRFAGITSAASVAGGMAGYLIGYLFFDTVGIKIIEFYGVMDKYWLFREWFEKYNFAIIMVAGLTPLPYKVFTITAGVAGVNFPIFVLGSVLSRSLRFMAEGVVCYYGDFFSHRVFKMPIKEALDKYINLFGALMAVLGVAGFIVVKVALPGGEVNICRDELMDGSSVTVCFKGVERESDKLIDYALEINGAGLDAKATVSGGPFKKASSGSADLGMVRVNDHTLLIAAVYYKDLDLVKRKGTDGIIVFFRFEDGRLEYLESQPFARYRMGEKGAWSESAVALGAKDQDPERTLVVTLSTVVHPGWDGGEVKKSQEVHYYKLKDKLEKIVKFEPEAPAPAVPGESSPDE